MALMKCQTCAELKNITDLSRPYVKRSCMKCGRVIKIRPAGAHGIGLKFDKGDKLVIPSKFLTMSANPLKGNARLTSYGLSRYAELVYGVGIAKKVNKDKMRGLIRELMEANEGFFKNSEYIKDLDIDDPDDAEKLFFRLNEHPKTTEWWGYLAAGFGSIALSAIDEGDAPEAAWAMAVAERLRALAIFKSHFEETVFMGHSAYRLIDFLRVWDSNKENGDEGFWQAKLEENTYAVSQLFSVPVTFIGGNAYVGGMKIDGKGARYVDFMYSGGSSNDAILVEIKTPKTKLLGAKYRSNVYSPSAALGGSIVQVNDYCHSLQERIDLENKNGSELTVFNPKRVIIAGNYKKELSTSTKITSFELFRSSLNNVEIVTFDEFFRKIEMLANLFNLTREKKDTDGNA